MLHAGSEIFHDAKGGGSHVDVMMMSPVESERPLSLESQAQLQKWVCLWNYTLLAGQSIMNTIIEFYIFVAMLCCAAIFDMLCSAPRHIGLKVRL